MVQREHLADVSKWFFDNITQRDMPFDVIGLSFYPSEKSGTFAGLAEMLAFDSQTYGKDVIVAETTYGWNGGTPTLKEYPPTPLGQRACFE
jgi:arabinogalactan endo-1,4-beta-galactosidase